MGKRAGPGLAAKRRKRRKKDRGSGLCLHGFKAGLQFCSVNACTELSERSRDELHLDITEAFTL